MMKIFKYFIFIFIILAGGFLFSYSKGINKAASEDNIEVKFIISTGDGVKKIRNNLFSKKLIKSKLFFDIYVWRNKLAGDFKAGSYRINTSLNIKDIVEKLTRGQIVVDEQEIKIIEGWTINDIAKYFEDKGIASKKDFFDMVGEQMRSKCDNKKLNKETYFLDKFLVLTDKPACRSYEGYLFPDTYKVYKNASLENIISKMFSNLERKITPKMLEDIKKQKKSVYEILTMASVIQKEVRGEKDMKIVSGIFWNRMRDHHPLQSCASLAYILGVNKKVYSIADTKINSPYNTYQNVGLPPGPISNPGLKAIEAAIYPTKTDYYFFLSKSSNGETVFSKNLREHNLNKVKYIK